MQCLAPVMTAQIMCHRRENWGLM